MTITIYFHLSGYRTFKTYYKEHVSTVLKPYFPKLVSYDRFVELMQESLNELKFSNSCYFRNSIMRMLKLLSKNLMK